MRTSGFSSKCYWWCLAVFFLFGSATTLQASWLTIHNDFEMYDSDGNAIQTRSGCLRKFGDTYYWYGSESDTGHKFTDQTCYSSTDLLHWTNKGIVIKAPGTNRVDVIYNDSTKQYVMYLKTGTGSGCDLGIATSSTPDGQFVLKGNNKVFGYQIGDMSVYQDDDGKAYFLYVWDSIPGANSGDKSQHALALLSPDYLSLSKRLWLWDAGWREAPMMMKHKGIYYYLTSLTMWVQSTTTQYYTAPGVSGPWTTKLVPMITPGNTKNNSWDTQCDFVFPFKGPKDTVYMYCGDRWEKPDPMRVGDYVWLPITFSPRDSVVVNYYQDWEVNPDLGLWRPIDSKRNLALHKTATASSTSGANTANNVTDSSTWQNYANTKWTSAASDPQWISVDLGSSKPINRVILKWDSSYAKSFQIQVSTDASSWKDVFSTTHAGLRSVTDETFPTTTARYVRMYGTQRGNDSNGYSLFDFMVLNDSVTTETKFKPSVSSVHSRAMLTFKNNTICYNISSDNCVKLDIVDGRGKLVAVLVDRFEYAGNHEVVMSRKLSSGMYMIRLSVGAKRISAMKVRL